MLMCGWLARPSVGGWVSAFNGLLATEEASQESHQMFCAQVVRLAHEIGGESEAPIWENFQI